MKKFAGFVVTLAALAVSAFAGPYDAWSHYRDVTVNTTTAAVTTTQTDFPLLVRLTNASDASGANVLSEALALGADVRFATSDGATALSYEIESWSASDAAIWVKVPSIAGSSTTTIRLYWGKGDATTASSPSTVFDVANGFRAVYHLNQASGAATDATANGYNAATCTVTGNVTAVPSNVTGLIGNAKDFLGAGSNNNTTGACYTIASTNASAPRLNFNTNGDFYTISAWVKANTLPTAAGNPTRMGVVMKYGSTGANQQYALVGVGNGTAPTSRWSGNHKVAPGGEAWAEVGATTGVWQYVATVRSGAGVGSTQTTAKIYLNGVVSAVTASGNTTTTSAGTAGDLVIGAYSTSPRDRFLNGQIDEVRLDSTARSVDWIKLSYETQKAAVTAVTLGTSQTQGGATAPGAPTAVSGTPGNGQVSVVFTAPVSDGGSAITSYTVTSHPGSFTGTGASSPIVVSDLANGTSYTFTVTATNSIGAGAASDTSTAVTPNAPPSITYETPKVYVASAAIDTLKPASTGGPVTAYVLLDSLPAGLSLNPSTGNVTGTPSGTSAATDYRIQATGPGGLDTATVSITVNAAVPVIAYTGPQTYVVGTGITTLNVSSTGGPVTSYAISPNLTTNTGLSFNTTSGAISGTPTTAQSAATYTIIATGSGGLDTATVSITVNAAVPVIAYTGPQTYVVGTGITTLNVSSTGGPVTSYAISPNLTTNTGLSFNTTSGAISGTPTTAQSAATYTIIATGPGGLDTATVSITVLVAVPTISSPSTVTDTTTKLATHNAITTGTITSCAVSGTPLPLGLTVNNTSCAITGTPSTITGAATYTIIASNGTGSDTATISITVVGPVGILPGAFVIRVNGAEKPYAFQLPSGTTTEKLTLSITDAWGRTVWSKTVNPSRDNLREIAWNGKSSNGRQASAGMYVVRISVESAGKTTTLVNKSVSLKPH